MISIVLLLITILSAYIVVMAGASAFEITGLDKETAHFQALSAFTGTGFTTRASERVVNDPVRRRITVAMIILGYAGTATVVASLVSSVDSESALHSLRNIAALFILGGLAWWLLRRVGGRFLDSTIRRLVMKRMREEVHHEELKLYKAGFGISRVLVPAGSAVIGKALKDLELRELHLQVLAVESGDRVQPIPSPDHVFKEGQQVILYGKIEMVEKVFRAGGLRNSA